MRENVYSQVDGHTVEGQAFIAIESRCEGGSPGKLFEQQCMIRSTNDGERNVGQQ